MKYFHLVLNAPKEPYGWKKVISLSLFVPQSPFTETKTKTPQNQL